jgi:uncharacterized protein YhhL (DUF1145 family)
VRLCLEWFRLVQSDPCRVAQVSVLGASIIDLGAVQFGAREGTRAPMWASALLVSKLVVVGYWLWVAKVLVLGSSSGFEAVVGLSAPLILSFHFIQALILLRRIRSTEPFWKQLGQTLLFGALYIAPQLLGPSPAHAGKAVSARGGRSSSPSR